MSRRLPTPPIAVVFVLLLVASVLGPILMPGAEALGESAYDANSVVSDPNHFDVNSGQSVAQSFVASDHYTILSVTLRLRNSGDTTDAINITLRADASGVPSVSYLLAADLVVGDTTINQRTVTFTSSLALVQGTRYWIVAQTSSGSSNGYEWHHSNANTYSPGKAMQTMGLLGWSDPPLLPTDMYFVTRGRPTEATLAAGIVPTTGDIQPGDLVTFRITLSNAGTASAGTAWLNDTLLPGFTFVGDNATDAGAMTGHPAYTFVDVANGARWFELTARVDPSTEPGTVLSKVFRLRYTDSTGAARSALDASASVIVGIVTKSLYLHPDAVGAAKRLSAAKPADGGAQFSELLERDDSAHDFDLDPALARAFHSVGASAVLHIDTDDGSERNLDVNLTISEWDGFTLVPIAHVQRRITTNNMPDFQAFDFGFPAVDHTFAAGSRIRLTVVNRATGDRDFHLAMNSMSAPSALGLRTTTYVRIDTFELRDSVAVASVWSPKDTLVVYANVSDPFGTSEIAEARATVTTPSGAEVGGPMAVLQTDPSVPSTWRAFQISVGPPLDNGTYAVVVRAEESDGARDLAEGTATVRAPRFTLEKTANETAVYPGDPFTYELWYNNTGTGPAWQVWLNDSLPAGVTFIDSSDPGAMTGNYTWAWSSVAPGSHRLQIHVEAAGGSAFFRNRAFLNYTDEKAFLWPTRDAEVNVSFNGPAVDLRISPGDFSIHSNETIVYTIALNNTGDASPTLWLNETLPDRAAYVADTADAIGGVRSGSGRFPNFTFNAMPAGARWNFTLTVRVDAAVGFGTGLRNQATLTYSNTNGDIMPERTRASTATVVAPYLTGARISMAGPVVSAGDTVPVVIEYSNDGNEAAREVWINLTVDAYLTFVDAAGEPLSTEPSLQVLVQDVEPGPANLSLRVKVNTTVPDNRRLWLNGTQAYTDGFGNSLPSVIIQADSVLALAPSFVFTTSPHNVTIEAGRSQTFAVMLRNEGSDEAGDVELSLSLPSGFLYGGDTADVEPALQGSSTLVWRWTDVAPGITKQFGIVVRASASVPDNTVGNLAFNLMYEDAYGNDRGSLPIVIRATIEAPTLWMSLVPSTDLVRPGDAVTFTLAIRNLGSTAMRNLWLTTDLHAAFEFLFQRSPVTPDRTTGVNWSFSDFQPGELVEVSLVVRLRSGTPANEMVQMTFRASYTNSEGDPISTALFEDASIRVEDTLLFFATLIGLGIAVATVIVVLVRRHRTQIEEVFLVNSDGVLLYHIARSLSDDKDEDVLSGMLTAVQEFVKDAFQYGERRGLSHLDFGDYRILIERGDHVYLAVVYSGRGAQFLRRRMRRVLRTIEVAYGKVLDLWDGDMEKVLGAKDIIREYLLKSRGSRGAAEEPKPA